MAGLLDLIMPKQAGGGLLNKQMEEEYRRQKIAAGIRNIGRSIQALSMGQMSQGSETGPDMNQMLQIQEYQRQQQGQEAQAGQWAETVGGLDPRSGITWDTGRQGANQPGAGLLGMAQQRGMDPALMQGMLQGLGPEAGGKALYDMSQPEAQIEQYEPVTDAEGNIVGQRSSTSGKVVDDPRAPDRRSAMEEKINEIVSTFGVPRQTAAGIATGAYRVVVDPLTNQPFLVDLATGTQRPLNVGASTAPPSGQSPQAAARAVPGQAEQGAAEKGTPSAGTLWELTNKSAGVIPSIREFGLETLGQISDSFVADDTIQARQAFRSAQNEFIRAMSINPRFPVGEINRLRQETRMEPRAFDSPGALRARMTAVTRYLENRLLNENDASQNAGLPIETRRAAAQAANDIQNFVRALGVPQEEGTDNRTGPAIGTVDGDYRFKGGDPGDPASWQKIR